ncbi:hypothetical protein VTN77DRAFT_124 [Rasamsonia byssochlamydoides]|uniref:uncharacterized protein n=1 Tax=Rasamsonia byssochlamydoides TaxID=89139 RepID=UPI003743A1F4
MTKRTSYEGHSAHFFQILTDRYGLSGAPSSKCLVSFTIQSSEAWSPPRQAFREDLHAEGDDIPPPEETVDGGSNVLTDAEQPSATGPSQASQVDNPIVRAENSLAVIGAITPYC